jgi:hypothetical protein
VGAIAIRAKYRLVFCLYGSEQKFVVTVANTEPIKEALCGYNRKLPSDNEFTATPLMAWLPAFTRTTLRRRTKPRICGFAGNVATASLSSRACGRKVPEAYGTMSGGGGIVPWIEFRPAVHIASGTPENRPMEDTSKPANGNGQDRSC